MRRVVAVMLGGAVGATVRWLVGLWLPHTDGLPAATLVVNVSGAFALGLLGVLVSERLTPSRWLRPLLGTGFLGAYTTFSTMAVEGVELIASGQVAVAAVYWLVTLVGGQMAGVYGMWLGRLGRHERGPVVREPEGNGAAATDPGT